MPGEAATEKAAKIISLEAEHFKRLRAVEIKCAPDGGLIVISGRNGQGKSSVLDAIMAALGGTKAVPPKPIHEGEEKAEVRVKLSTDAGELLVTRRFTQKGSTLKVEGAQGQTFKSPQALLDAFLGHLTFDPLEFTRMKPADQRAVLLGVVDVGIDLDANAGDRQKAYDERTEVNREIKTLEGKTQVEPPEGFESWEDVPTSEVSAIKIAEKLEAAQDMLRHTETLETEYREEMVAAQTQKERIARLRKELQEAEGALEGFLSEAMRLRVESAKARDVEPDVQAIRDELATIEDRNVAARAKGALAGVLGDLKVRRGDADTLTKRIERLDADRTRALREAAFPVEGLTVGVEGVLYKGLPLEQAAQSEQLKVSTAIAMALNPKLHVLRIQDGSLLDAQSMAQLQAMAAEHDYQLWIERVADGEGVGIVIEDGQVVSNT